MRLILFFTSLGSPPLKWHTGCAIRHAHCTVISLLWVPRDRIKRLFCYDSRLYIKVDVTTFDTCLAYDLKCYCCKSIRGKYVVPLQLTLSSLNTIWRKLYQSIHFCYYKYFSSTFLPLFFLFPLLFPSNGSLLNLKVR